jgi:hypothetical protein
MNWIFKHNYLYRAIQIESSNTIICTTRYELNLQTQLRIISVFTIFKILFTNAVICGYQIFQNSNESTNQM